MSILVDSIRDRLLQVRERISRAARAAGREPASVRLVVVSKGQGVDVVRAAIQAGAGMLGENYPEEGADKIAVLGAETGVEWHMIGHVQSRKAALIPGRYALFHALDSFKLAVKLDKLCASSGLRLPVLLELNVGLEANKYGWPIAGEAGLAGSLEEIERILALPHLQVRGLMTMPPLSASPEQARPEFVRLRRLQESLSRRCPQADWGQLSMGTSGDFEIAVAEGATLVRVGTAILGPRPG